MRGRWQLVEVESGRVIVPHLELAVSFLGRLIGLQFRSSLPDGHGLLIAPCNGIHTCCLRFPIDCAYLDSKGLVLEVRRNIRPWRVSGPVRGASAVLEVAGGTVGLAHGDSVCLQGIGQDQFTLPHWLSEMACPASSYTAE